MADDGFEEDLQEEQSGEDAPPEEECPAGAPLWMVTFGDMMSLLVCFFVILISFSNMDVIKYRSLVGSLRSAFGSQSAIVSSVITGQISAVSLGESHDGAKSMTEEDLENELVSSVEKEGFTGDATIHRTDRGIVLRVRENIAFSPGSADIQAESFKFLDKVAKVCRLFNRKIYIEGHTDNIPMQSEDFPSNWELSSVRASAIVRYMLDVHHLMPEKFVASGFASTVPIASNMTIHGRATNRRVEFIFSGRPSASDM
jgi:chemotaxis protein MotB